MCGIAGVVKIGDKPINREMLELLLVGNEHRGVDASGIVISQADGSLDVYKKDEIAWQFVTSDGWNEFITQRLKADSWAVLLHTRAATTSNPRNNVNNHPMFAGCSAIIHNGGISNERELYHKFDVKQCAETDSDIIRAIADKYGITKECAEALKDIRGTVASAIVHPNYPKNLFIMRSGSPMTLGSDENFFIFSSEKNTIHSAARPTVKRFGLNWQSNKVDLAFSPMPDNTIWWFDANGHKGHYPFPAFSGVYKEPNRRTYDGYADRQKDWTSYAKPVEQPDQVTEYKQAWCFHCKQEWIVPKDEAEYKYTCDLKEKGCGRALSPFPKDKK
jgi:asparagine synthetase B (glutamine-hydrolysing)